MSGQQKKKTNFDQHFQAQFDRNRLIKNEHPVCK